LIRKLAQISYAKKNVASVLLIAILATIIYSNSFDCLFHFDDQHAIVENYAIHRFDLKEIFSTSTRPILDLTLALNYYFGKLNVFGYHLVNLMLHIVNGIMLYFILLWTVNPVNHVTPTNSRNSTNPINFKVPLYASLIFIAHPIQTQAVTYIISRSSVLATSFYLLSLLLFIKAFKQRAKSEEQRAKDSMPYALRPKLYLIGAFLASCLGMGTKQIVATLPLMLLIYDFYFISDGNWKILKGHYKVHMVMFSTAAIVFYLSLFGLKTFISFDYAKGVDMPLGEPITSFQYFMTQLHVIPYYIKLLFIPTNLNLDYDWPITKSIDLSTTFFFIHLSSIVILAIMLFNRSRLLSFGIIWFFVTLSVTSSFIVIYDVIFEHRLYLPSIGFAIFMALMINRISQMRFGKKPS